MNPLFKIKNSTVIIAALDWGFGHTTRCHYIINQLQKNKNTIHFAGNDHQVNFFKHEFSNIIYHTLNGYEIILDDKRNTYFQLIHQSKNIIKSIKSEHVFLQNLAQTYHFDFIISDNRYGFYLENKRSYIICHQLNLCIPYGKKIINFFHRNILNKFDACLIPDYADKRLSNSLSTAKLKIPQHFIGSLSRFKVMKEKSEAFNCCFILSGPEPARSNFLNLIENHIDKKSLSNICIVGKKKKSTKKITYIYQPTTEKLNIILTNSNLLVSRAGYTTIMEIEAIKKSAILIPTPGQYEQEYLAKTVKIKTITFKTEHNFFND